MGSLLLHTALVTRQKADRTEEDSKAILVHPNAVNQS